MLYSPVSAGAGNSATELAVFCLLPLALGVLGTLVVMALFGRKPPPDQSAALGDLQSLLSVRDRELRDRDTELGNLRTQLGNVEEEYTSLRGNRERLEADFKATEKRAADAGSQIVALQSDLTNSNTARLKYEQDLKRKDADMSALNARLTAALGDFDKAKTAAAAQLAALTAGAATAAAAIKSKETRIGELEAKIKTLEGSVAAKASLEANLAARGKEIDDYKLRLGKLEAAVAEGGDLKLKADKELADLRAQLAASKADGDKAKAAAAAELAVLTAKAARVGELEARVQALQGELDLRARETGDFKLRFEKADTDLKAAVSAKNDWDVKMAGKDKEVADMRLQLTTLTSDAEKAKAVAAAELAALTAGAAAAAVTIKSRDGRIGELETRVKALEGDLNLRAKEAGDLKMRFEKADTDLKATVSAKDDWEAKFAAASADLQGKTGRISELETRIKALEDDIAARIQESGDLKTRFEKADADLKATVSTHSDIDAKLQAKDQELADLRAQLTAAHSEGFKAKTAAAAELAALTAGAAAAAAALKGKDGRIGELETRITALEGDLTARARAADDLKVRLENADNELKVSFASKGQWESSLKEKDAELNDVRARVAKLEADLRIGMNDKARAEADRDLRDRELSDLRLRLSGLQGEADKARAAAAAELAALTAGAATAAAALKNKDGRIGDLERRLAAMEAELGGIRNRREQALVDAQQEIAALRASSTKSNADWEARLLARDTEWQAKLETRPPQLAETGALFLNSQASRTSVEAGAAKLGVKIVPAACPQHLSDIHGIGAVFEGRLYENGIGTFFEVAQLSDDDFRRMLKISDDMVRSVDFDKIRADALKLAKDSDTMGRTWSGQDPDDFEPIDGIGHTFEKRLYDAGICTYEALVNTSVERLEQIISRGKKMVTKPNIPHWISQARALLAEKSNR
jgi:chromosome segregation ATPase